MEAGLSCFSGAEMGREGVQDMPWGLGFQGLKIRQFSWETNYLPALPIGVGGACPDTSVSYNILLGFILSETSIYCHQFVLSVGRVRCWD